MNKNKKFIFNNNEFMGFRIFVFLTFLFTFLFAFYIVKNAFFIYTLAAGVFLSALLFINRDIKSIEIDYENKTLKLMFSNIFNKKIIILNKDEIQNIKLSKISGFNPFSLIEIETTHHKRVKLYFPLEVISNWFYPIKEVHGTDVMMAFDEIKSFKNSI